MQSLCSRRRARPTEQNQPVTDTPLVLPAAYAPSNYYMTLCRPRVINDISDVSTTRAVRNGVFHTGGTPSTRLKPEIP